jgi:hypothetical protein
MATIVFGNLFIFLVICGIVAFKGLDLKKPSSWWYGLYAFMSGFMIGFLRSDGSGGYYVVTNLTASFQAGIVFLVILLGSVMTHWQKTKAEKYLGHPQEGYQEQFGNLAESLFKDRLKKK